MGRWNLKELYCSNNKKIPRIESLIILRDTVREYKKDDIVFNEKGYMYLNR